MKKLLYVYNVKTTWTAKDLATLQENYNVDEAYINTKTAALLNANPFKIFKYDKVFCWFGSLKFIPVLILAKFFQKEIIVVAGGFDVACVPKINYGGFCRSHISHQLRKLIFKLANKVITVSQYNTLEALQNAKVAPEKTKMIYHGFQTQDRKVKPFLDRKNTVLTVGAINKETMERKGHRRFLRLAKECPEMNFIMAGKIDPACKVELERTDLKNLKAPGFVSDKELLELMSNSKFYVQLSEHEAFGCSVVEAGMAGCTIIVSNKSALPEVVGSEGHIFNPDDISSIKGFISKKAESIDLDNSKRSLKYSERFSEISRKKELLKFIQ